MGSILRPRERCVHYVCWILVQLFNLEIGNSVFLSSFYVGYEYYNVKLKSVNSLYYKVWVMKDLTNFKKSDLVDCFEMKIIWTLVKLLTCLLALLCDVYVILLTCTSFELWGVNWSSWIIVLKNVLKLFLLPNKLLLLNKSRW